MTRVSHTLIKLSFIVTHAAIIVVASAMMATSAAQERSSSTISWLAPERNLAEEWENLGLLHRDDRHPWLQEFWLLGRYHGQYYDADGSTGEQTRWEDRRFRYGFQARMLDRLTLHAQAISGADFDTDYNGFTELWLRWQFAEAWLLTIGQQKHRVTHDRNISSRYMNTIERSQFTNMMALDYTPAITLSGENGPLNYYTGVFSNGTGTNMVKAFSELNSGWSYLAAITYDLGNFLGAEHAEFYGSIVHSDANSRATNFTRFDDAVSGALILTKGSASLITELTHGMGGDAGRATGLSIQPGFYLTDQLQIVARYQIATAQQENGLIPQFRYEQPLGMPRGDFYQACYLGFSYYIAAHRMKMIGGIEYANMNGEHLVTAAIGFRLFFGPQSDAPFPGNKMLPGWW